MNVTVYVLYVLNVINYLTQNIRFIVRPLYETHHIDSLNVTGMVKYNQCTDYIFYPLYIQWNLAIKATQGTTGIGGRK